jgi:hypothetical protein
VSDELKLLVEWSSPWQEFKEAIGPAFARSGKPLAGEARVGLFPYRGMLISWAGEFLLFVTALMIARGYDSMHPYQPPPPAKYDVIYYSGDELPKVEDVGGVQSGRTGKSGGREGFHRTQTIRVAREERLREKVVDAPKLNLPHSDTAVANLLAYKSVPGPPPAEGVKSSLRALQAPRLDAVAPAPEISRDRMQAAPALNSGVVAPAPQVDRNQMQAAPALTTSIVPPAPNAQNVASLRLPGSHPMQVVPPPVSAPERDPNSNPKLTLPAQAVVAPPVQVTRDPAAQGPGFGSGDLRKQVVPPPVQMGSANGDSRAVAGLGSSSVVPPPVQMGSANGDSRSMAGLGSSGVVPPPVQVGGGVGNGSMSHQPVSGLGGGLGAVPPAPTVSGGSSITGHGRGNRGMGSGGVGDIGEVAAPPNGGGAGKGVGVVVSNQPGSKVGMPGGGGAGSLAMSPNGGANPGVGGSGGGSGIGRGNGSGSGLYGAGSGAARDGSGRGSDTYARNGISPFPGPGGTGAGGSNSPATVRGGSNPGIVTLPSFGGEGSQQPNVPGRSSTGVDDRPGLSIEASPRSGGAFNFYGGLKGDKVYTIYIDTVLGTAVMEFADPTSAEHPYSHDLTVPRPIRADLPASLRRSRLVIACVLDRSGEVRSAQVMESNDPQTTARVLAALRSWKFHPAMRGDQPIEVNALLGFDIDTSDRN